MRVIQHTTSLRPHIWQQRFFWSEARFVGIIAAYSDCNDFAVLGH